jgi:NhaA family Na+:H+ antiporter
MARLFTQKAKAARLSRLFLEFYGKLSAGGALLVICAGISLILANSSIAAGWIHFWKMELDFGVPGLHAHTLTGWINDGLMTVFFLLVGLEIERELLVGELSDRKTALLPVLAAVGGMLFPALVFLAINISHPLNWKGAGIPTATDIAFAMAILKTLSRRIPPSLAVFLTALAIIDDLGAILVIAIFYGQGIHFLWLGLALLLFVLLLFVKRRGIQNLWFYLPAGLLLWWLMMQSGIHATISGVMLAFAIPFGKKDGENSPSHRLMDLLHEPVGWIILPVFALANTALPLTGNLAELLNEPLPLGIVAGLIVGKPFGIWLASMISARIGLAAIPPGVNGRLILGAGLLGGIGFTMAMFVSNLAFTNAHLTELSKLAVLICSCLAAVVGYGFLRLVTKQ